MHRLQLSCFLSFSLSLLPCWSSAQSWTPKANYGGTPRNRACSFSVSSLHKLYIVGGYDFGYEQDVWEYDTITNAWTLKTPFPGASTTAVAFSVNGKGYVGTGVGGGYSWTNSFYEYDPIADTWTIKANFPGTARGYCVGFAIGDKGYIGGGFTGTPGVFVWFDDFYEYDPSIDTWTAIANYPGAGAALGASGFSLNGKGYVGCGSSIDVNGNQTLHNDFWEYDSSSNSWTQKSDFAGGIRGEATSFSTCDRGYIGLGYSVPHAVFENDFWEYNPAIDTWSAIPNFGGIARAYAPGCAIGKSGYAGTGFDGVTLMNDFWEYHNSYVAGFTGVPTSICAGDSVSFTDQSNFTAMSWDWNFPGGNPASSAQQNPVVTYTVAGTYNVTMTAYGCDSASVTQTNYVTVTAVPATPNLGNDTLFCGNFLLQLSAGGTGLQYLWSTGDTASTIQVSSPGTFSVTVSSSCGIESDTIILQQDSPPLVFAGNDTVLCNSVNLVLSATGNGDDYLWSTGETDSSIVISSGGIFSVTASNVCGTATDSVVVKLLFPPSVYLGNDTSLCDFSNFVLNGGSADSYSWSTGSSDSSISIPAPGIYWVSASNFCGTSADTILIAPCEAIYLVASAFSPNDDGVNDLLSLIKIGDATLINFSVFNRWGQLIFETGDDSKSWNGMFKNRKEEIGVYVFTLRFRDDNTGKESMRAGNITLIR